MINILTVEAFEDNYIFTILDTITKHVIIVDPGDTEAIEDFLNFHHYVPDNILVTHHHGDHVGAVSELYSDYRCDIVAPIKEISLIPDVQHAVRDGQQLTLMKLQCQVIETIGHTKGHVCYYFPELKSLFCGDTLFALGCGRLFGGTAAQLWHALQKLAALPDDTMVYCAHEYTLTNAEFTLHMLESWGIPPSDLLQKRIETFKQMRADNRPTVPVLLGEEKQTNLFFHADDSQIIEKMGAYGEVDCFTKLRTARNHFKAA